MDERSIPEAVLRDKNAVEMLRVWIAGNRIHCSIKVGMYLESTRIPEERAWGVILADVARHISIALDSGFSLNRYESLNKIEESFLQELTNPTSPVEGEFSRET